MARTLTLTSPLMTGPDVEVVQRALKVTPDGVFGPVTAQAVKAWRYRVGFPQAIPALGPDGQDILLGRKPVPASYRARVAARGKPAPPPALTVPEKAVEVMLGWAAAGLKENPADSNRVPDLQALAKALGLAPWYQAMGWPWCAFSANLAALKVGGQTATAGLRLGRFNALYCPAILTAAEHGDHGMKVVPASLARRGDLVLFDWQHDGTSDHIGRITAAPAGGSVATVEGNTSSGPGGSQSNGGGVYRRIRPLTDVRAFIRDS